MDLLLDAYAESSSSGAEDEGDVKAGANIEPGEDASDRHALGHKRKERSSAAKGQDNRDDDAEDDGEEATVVFTEKKQELLQRTVTKKHKTEQRVRLPPPPADILGGEGAAADEETSRHAGREAHLGRIRSFPHIEGNYPTFVYIPAVPGLLQCIDALTEQFRAWLPGHQVHPMTETKEIDSGIAVDNTTSQSLPKWKGSDKPLELIYHVSISRTVGVRQHQIDPLIELLRSTFSNECSFEASFDAYELFTNDEKTRSFLSLSVVEGVEYVCGLITKVDQVFKQFRLLTFYEDPRPHMTIAWTLGDVMSRDQFQGENTIPRCMCSGQSQPLRPKFGGPYRFRVNRIQCTPGRNIYDFPLS